METKILGPEHKKLNALSGRWLCEENLYPTLINTQSGASTGRMVARVELNGFVLVQHYVREIKGDIVYEGRGFIGYDSEEKCYTLFWADSAGYQSKQPAKGQWNNNKLVFTNQRSEGYIRHSTEFLNQETYRFTLEHSIDQETWSIAVESRCKKVRDPIMDELGMS